MSNLVLQQNNLPENIEDLSKFALIGREKLTSVRAEIQAIDKLRLANDVKEQKLQEAQNIAEIVLDAETRIGELLKEVPTKITGRPLKESSISADTTFTPKQQAQSDIGISKQQAVRFMKLAENKPIVEQAKAEAREKGEIVTRQAVIEKAKEVQKEQRHEEIKKKFESVQKNIYSGKVLEGDLFQKINEVDNNSIDMLFADPPYMILNEKWDRYENIRTFMNFTKEWLEAVIPKIKQTGRIYISFSQYYQFELYNLLKENDFYGFNFGQMIIWNYRNNNKPSDKKMYRFAYEPVFYLYGKQADVLNFPPETYGEIQSNVWTIATPQSNFNEGKFHPAQKPLELLERIVLTGSKEGDTILDPFAGSGTTGIAAQKLKRNFILIEKENEYCQIARGRLNGVDGKSV